MPNNALFFVKQLQKSSSADGSTSRLLLSYFKLHLKTFLVHTLCIKHSIIILKTKLTIVYGLNQHFAWTFRFKARSIMDASKSPPNIFYGYISVTNVRLS